MSTRVIYARVKKICGNDRVIPAIGFGYLVVIQSKLRTITNIKLALLVAKRVFVSLDPCVMNKKDNVIIVSEHLARGKFDEAYRLVNGGSNNIYELTTCYSLSLPDIRRSTTMD